ncbi:BOLA class I histocompatibility antigen, alpha chain BL3-6-like [Clarias gariepinus]|uniref:BOLA class I histocompatibility antigen, alpha chain BL3-7-like n=1 Tax=Clarias gariepinus TaxID=13013 RepID=UPI00234CBA3D|nr:BOLA class I histocompatibility antigen, alpha chain BL3-7-like [Clarias gariepinus]
MCHCSVVIKALILLTFSLHLSSAVTHSLQYLYTAVTPGINVPEFTVVGLVDGQEFEYYDSDLSKVIPKTEWILKVTVNEPNYWNRHTELYHFWQKNFKTGLNMVMKDFNHTTGIHTLQWMYGCEFDDRTGYVRLGYDGEDFLCLNVTTKTWITAKPGVVISDRIWDYINGLSTDGQKNYVSTDCIQRINQYVSYGRETLERKVHPKVSLFHKQSSYPEVVCHATGFFPKALNITWQKDGEDVHEDVELRETLPNQDGSFQKRIILKVPAEELHKHNYTCVVQHSSLEKELVREVPKGGAPIAIITAVVAALAALAALVAVVAGIVVWKKKNSGFRPVPPKPSSEGDSSNTSLKCNCGDNDTLCLD